MDESGLKGPRYASIGMNDVLLLILIGVFGQWDVADINDILYSLYMLAAQKKLKMPHF